MLKLDQKNTLSNDSTWLDFWDNTFISADGKYFSPGYIGPDYLSNPWSTIIIGDQASPGLCEINVTRKRAIDKKKPSGTDIGTVTAHGILPAEFDIEFQIWTPQQWYLLKVFLNDSTIPAQVYKKVLKTKMKEVASSNTQSTSVPLTSYASPTSNTFSFTANGPTLFPPKTSATANSTSYETVTSTSTQLVNGTQALLPKPGSSPGIFPIIHPALAFHGITHMMPIGLTIHKIGKDRIGRFILHCVEFHQKDDQTPVTATPQIPSSILSTSPIIPPGQAQAQNNQNIQANNGAGIATNSFTNAANTTIPTPTPIASV